MFNKKFNSCARLYLVTAFGLSQGNVVTSALADEAILKADDTLLPVNITVEDIIRAKIIDGIPLVDPAKAEVAQATTAFELQVIADTWNSQANGGGAVSKYVKSVLIDSSTGEITITYNEANVGSIPANSTLVFTPYIQTGSAPIQLAGSYSSGFVGAMDWGCSSVTNSVSASQNLSAISAGTLPSTYAPFECR
jgi:type IV pilus assembly protein PilA